MKRFLGLLGWLGVALVTAALIIRFSKPELLQWSQGLALAGLVVTGLYTLSQWRDIARSFQGRNVKYGSIAASSVVLVLGILVAINWIANRQNKRWDLTAGGQFSLSDQTKKLLGEIQKPVTIKAFYAGSSDSVRDRLNDYQYLSKNVTLTLVDAERNPLEAQSAGITTVPTVFVQYEGRSEKANSPDEQSVTNALKKVIEGKAKKVYFVQGHGEHDPGGSESTGYNTIDGALKTDNFETAKLTLAQEGKVPDDATVLIIAGPKTDLLPGELDAIRAFLKRGGKLMVMVDPPDKGTAADPTGLMAFVKEWGMSFGNDLIVDASGLGQLLGTDASVPVAMPVQHPITDNFRVMTAFPLARSVQIIEGGTNGHIAQKFLETSPQSWAESDVKGLFATGRPERDPAKGDTVGPIAIAGAVAAAVQDAAAPATPAPATPDAPKPETRVVVFGDSDFASNRALSIQGNRDLFLNSVNWLAQQEDLIAIRPRSPQDRPVTMTADQSQMVFLFTMVVVPALLFLNGARVWWKRR